MATMKRNFRIWAAIGSSALTLAALPGRAQMKSLVDDFESGSNQNKFQYYWYFYNDAADSGDSKVMSAQDPDAKDLVFTGGYGGGYPDGSGNAAKFQWKFGAKKPYSPGCDCYYQPFVGMGATLAPEGSTVDLTGAGSISFQAKSTTATKLRFILLTSNITDYAFYQTEIDIGDTWKKVTIPLKKGRGGLNQPATWGAEADFDLSKVQQVQFVISKEINPKIAAEGALWVDDVEIEGYEYYPPMACKACVGAAGSQPADVVPLSDFEGNEPLRNERGYWWYAFDDKGARADAYSTFTSGAPLDTNGKPQLKISGNGYGGAEGKGAFIEFKLGSTFKEGQWDILPSVGLGTWVASEEGLEVLNADSLGANGIYFDIKTTGEVDWVRLEVKTDQDLGPNQGLMHQILLKGTGGEWKGAHVPFSALKLPDWNDAKELTEAQKVFKRSAILKLHFVYQGKAGQTGGIVLDNLAFTKGDNAAGLLQARPPVSGLWISRRGKVLLVRAPGQILFGGVARLIDVRGCTVAEAEARSGEASLGASGLKPGLYLVQLIGVGADGMRRSFSMPASILP